MVRGGEHAPPHAYNLCVKATRCAKKKLAQDTDIDIFFTFWTHFFHRNATHTHRITGAFRGTTPAHHGKSTAHGRAFQKKNGCPVC